MPRDLRSRRRDDDDYDDDRPRSRRRRDDDDRPRHSRGNSETNPWVIWGPIAGVVVIGLAIGIEFITKSKKTDSVTTPVVQNDDKIDGTTPKADSPKVISKNDTFPKADGICKFDPNPKQPPKNDDVIKARSAHLRIECSSEKVEKLYANDTGESGLCLGEATRPIYGRYAFTRDGALRYAGGESTQTMG